MSDQIQWQKENNEYLGAALDWLRLRLERVANQQEIDEAAGLMREAESRLQPPPALTVLAHRFGLSEFERNVLLLCAAIEFDSRIAGLCALAQGDATRSYPTFALTMTLFDDPAWDVLSPERPLRYWRMIEINQPGAQALTTSALRADEWVVNFLKGLRYLDDRLTPLLSRLSAAEEDDKLPPSQRLVVDSIVENLQRYVSTQNFPVVQLIGADNLTKRLVAAHTATALGLHIYRLPARLLPGQAAELEMLARLWERESFLLPVCLYLDAHDAESPIDSAGQTAPPLNRFLARSNGVFFLATRERLSHLDRDSISVDISKPTPAEQLSAWKELLGQQTNGLPARLSGQFNFNLTEIQQITGPLLLSNNSAELSDKVWDACLLTTRPRLDALAQRVDPRAKWEDIVLPPNEISLLKQIADQVDQRSRVYEDWGFGKKMNRGLGINALFAGESGTGKTMAAEVIANELRLNLYRIDLSAVVSKYIGETEKNLRRLFDAAEDGGTILFFDEADSLFGKRSEVKDSHDRYANIEVNYLLQRMESYRGLAILATNLKSALDAAFLRRLRFVVTFSLPELAERKAIWERMFPLAVPTDGLDFDRLARFNLAGGHIHSIALNAAFLAAQAGTAVTMPLVLSAARAEFRKLERPINEADFRWSPAGAAA
ncbi:MAG TPA: ATP-binding protein [Pyrinomonadaceae bacterium]|nr:ATP-binding protein [Pyrinomonadaceae bacterium]